LVDRRSSAPTVAVLRAVGTKSRRDVPICSPARQCRVTGNKMFRVPSGTAQSGVQFSVSSLRDSQTPEHDFPALPCRATDCFVPSELANAPRTIHVPRSTTHYSLLTTHYSLSTRSKPTTMSTRTCHHIHADGALCNAPAVRQRDYCRWHLSHIGRRMMAARARSRHQPLTLKLPLLEDPLAVQVALMQVLDAIASNDIEVQRGRALLSGLRFALLIRRGNRLTDRRQSLGSVAESRQHRTCFRGLHDRRPVLALRNALLAEGVARVIGASAPRYACRRWATHPRLESRRYHQWRTRRLDKAL
jgi:hypothetical protein